MKSRLGLSVLVFYGAILLTGSLLAHAENYQDWWSNPELSGMGLNIGQQDQNIFATWFMYDETENASFLLFYGNLDQNQTLTAELRRYFGPEPPAYNEALWRGEVVGTATIAFSSPEAGTFSYQYDGKTGSFPIQRYTFSPVNLSGTYNTTDVFTDTGCGQDGNGENVNLLTLTHDGSSLIADYGSAQVNLTVTQHGSVLTASGTFNEGGRTGTYSMSNIRLVHGFLTFDFLTIPDGGGDCRTVGKSAAVMRLPN